MQYFTITVMHFPWSTGCVKRKTQHSGLDKNQRGCWEQN